MDQEKHAAGVNAFCTRCRKLTPHARKPTEVLVRLDCTVCGRAKLMTAAEMRKLGQVHP